MTEQLWSLETLDIHSGSEIATASVSMKKGEELERKDVAHSYDGPFDAFCRVVERITDISPTVVDYNVHNTDEGRDSTASVRVGLVYGCLAAKGNGLSKDTSRATADAYMEAFNRLIEQGAVPDSSRDIPHRAVLVEAIKVLTKTAGTTLVA